MCINLTRRERRLLHFANYFKNCCLCSDPGRGHEHLLTEYPIHAKIPEEGLFFVLMTTHFDSVELADLFLHRCNWDQLIKLPSSSIQKLCESFFGETHFTGSLQIGDHRKNFKCATPLKKASETVRLLLDYRQTIGNFGSQAAFFEIGQNVVSFDLLYTRMKTTMPCFAQRLPRFDHLERLSRTHDFYCTPDRFYAEDSSGPLYGLSQVAFGVRLGKDCNIRKTDIERDLPPLWNQSVTAEYRLPQGCTYRTIILIIEQWFIAQIQKLLPAKLINDKAFMFDLESCLCNWQKDGERTHDTC